MANLKYARNIRIKESMANIEWLEPQPRASELLNGNITRRSAIAVTAIHPGEHLAEELDVLAIARGTGAQDTRADQPGDANPERNEEHHRGYGAAPGPFFWDERAVLAESAESI